ncbi:MAG: glycosyltransferase family 4 protein [Acidimicrobiia bacterium]
MTLRIGFVTPRYGPQVIGGAELGVRLLAEHLVSLGRAEVEVFSTCAVDAGTWADVLPAGMSTENGVSVHRFMSRSGRHVDFDALSEPVLRRSEDTPLADAQRWVEHQGPWCPDLLAGVESSACDVVAFSPYLYWPIVHGITASTKPVLLHGAAHDEPPFYLPVYDEVFERASGLVFYTHGERALVERRFPSVTSAPQIVLGLGSDAGAGDVGAARRAVGLSADRPYLVCVGRVDQGKGIETLVRFFAQYKTRHPSDLALVIVGPVVHQPPEHRDVIVAGRVDETVKWGLLSSAQILVSPSGFESFSFVVLEAWHAGTAVLVNGRCDATREHCERSGGGLWFGDYPTFEVCLERMLGPSALTDAMAALGRRYVRENFTWEIVTDRYVSFIDRLLASR